MRSTSPGMSAIPQTNAHTHTTRTVATTAHTRTASSSLRSLRNHFGGYYYGDEYIRVFSHTHMVGAGVLDYGNIGVMPITKSPNLLLVRRHALADAHAHAHAHAHTTTRSVLTTITHRPVVQLRLSVAVLAPVRRYGLASLTSQAEPGTDTTHALAGEVMNPGYYAVTLEDYSVRAELTATKRVGLHRYTFPSTATARNILFPIRSAVRVCRVALCVRRTRGVCCVQCVRQVQL
jgi:putative alpha-1,2-mannosidase